MWGDEQIALYACMMGISSSTRRVNVPARILLIRPPPIPVPHPVCVKKSIHIVLLELMVRHARSAYQDSQRDAHLRSVADHGTLIAQEQHFQIHPKSYGPRP